MEKIADLAKILKPGKVYTIVGQDDLLGFAQRTVIRLVSAEPCEYAQYKDACRLIYKVKRKRFSSNSYRRYLHGGDRFFVYEGDIEADTNPWKPAEITEGGCRVSSGKYRGFDRRYLVDAVNSVKSTPIFEHATTAFDRLTE